MARLLALLTLALLALASVLATPVPAIHDLHATTLDLYALEGDDNKSGYFAVRVERTDKIVDLDDVQETALAHSTDGGLDVDGTLLAARITNILFMFNVSPEGSVSIDGKSVPDGMSDVQVEADVQTGITADGEKLTEAELVGSWDRGLVGMKVHVDRAVSDDGVVHLSIAEVVTEINGQNVVQRNVLHQRVDINLDGTITYNKPCGAPDSVFADVNEEKERPDHGNGQDRHSHGRHGRKPCFRRKIVQWFRHLATPYKVFFAAVIGMSLGFLASVVVRLVTAAFFPKAAAVLIISEEASPFLTKVNMEILDEKLPIYTSDGYAKVASDEKESK